MNIRLGDRYSQAVVDLLKGRDYESQIVFQISTYINCDICRGRRLNWFRLFFPTRARSAAEAKKRIHS